jgi:hypothetical protein
MASAAGDAAAASAASGPLALLKRALHFVMHLDKVAVELVAPCVCGS